MKLSNQFVLILLLTVLNSCQLFKKTDKVPVSSTSDQIQEKKESVPRWISKQGQYEYAPARKRINDLLHTVLKVSFDWEKQYLYGEARLTFTPYFYPQDSVVLDAKGFDINSVVLVSEDIDSPIGERVDSLRYSYDSLKLTVFLNKTYKKGEIYTLSIDYVAKPNELEGGGSTAITSSKGLYFINPLGKDSLKPRQIWTQGETESSSCWFPTIDAPNEKTTQEMYITIEDSMTVLTNGVRVYAQEEEGGLKTEYWKMDLPHAPYLFMMAIGHFAVVDTTWKGKEVSYYVEPKYEPYAHDIFGNTPEMLSFYSEVFGVDYPWDKYAQVCVRDYVSGAMENTTATLHRETMQRTKRELLDGDYEKTIAHELAHHWFGDLVTCESWSNIPLNESFAVYAEYLWIEHKYGKTAADFHNRTELESYLVESRRKQEPLIRFHYEDKEDVFDRHSYEKGGRILHMLRRYVGDDAFFASLKDYLSQNKFKPAEYHHLRLSFEKITGEDLNWFFNQWFLSPGHPVLEVAKEINSTQVVLKVKQLQDTLYTRLYRIPVDVSYWINGRKHVKRVWIKAEQNQIIKFNTKDKAELVVFDLEQAIVGEVYQEMTIDEAITSFNTVDQYDVQKGAVERLLSKDNVALDTLGYNYNLDSFKVQEVLKKILKDGFWTLQIQVLDTLIKNKDPYDAVFERSVLNLILNTKKSHVRVKAIRWLANSANAKMFLPTIEEKLTDSSYAVIGEALSACVALKSNKINAVVEELMKLENYSIVKSLIEYFVSSEAYSKNYWILNKYKKGDYVDKYLWREVIAEFLNKAYMQEESIDDFVNELIKIAKNKNEHRYSRYSSYYILWKLDKVFGMKETRQEILQQEENQGIKKSYERLEKKLEEKKGK